MIAPTRGPERHRDGTSVSRASIDDVRQAPANLVAVARDDVAVARGNGTVHSQSSAEACESEPTSGFSAACWVR